MIGLDPPRHGEGDRAQRGGGGSRPTQRHEVYAARKLRQEMSLPEVMLWQKLRGGKAGAKFRRQHPIGPYVVDFFCREVGLIVEIDGQAHDVGNRPARDAMREAFLIGEGYRIVRIPAVDVLEDVDVVAASIAALAASPLHQPQAGGGGPPLDATR